MSQAISSSLLAATFLLSTGCIESRVDECSDGSICPGDKVCDLETNACVDPSVLIVDEPAIVLGELACGSAATKRVKLRNLRDVEVAFSASSSLNNIRITPSTGFVPANGFLEVEVAAVAEAEANVGALEGVVVFSTPTSTVSRLVEFDVSGALVTVDVGAIDFGISGIDSDSVVRSFVLHNEGNMPAEFNIEEPSAPFSLEGVDTSPLQPGETRSVTVSYSSPLIGSYSDSVKLNFGGTLCQAPPTQVELSSQTDDVPVSFNSGSLDFGTSGCGVAASMKSVRIINHQNFKENLTLELIGPDAESYEVSPTLGIEPGSAQDIEVVRRSITVPTIPRTRNATLLVYAEKSNFPFQILLSHHVEGAYLNVAGNLDFGDVEAQTNNERIIAVENSGNAVAAVQVSPGTVGILGGGGFHVSPSSFSLSGNGSALDVEVNAHVGQFHGAQGFEFTVDAEGQCNVAEVLDAQLSMGGHSRH